MAIDTASKRRSVSGVPYLPLGPGLTPDNTKPVAWRQQVAWNYSGIETLETEVVTGPITATVSLVPRVLGTVSATTRVIGTASIRRV